MRGVPGGRIMAAVLTAAAVAGVAVIAGGPASSAHADPSTPQSGARVASAAPTSPQGRAWSWIESQRGSGTVVTSASTITARQSYSDDWTGAVSGTFAPRGVSSPVTDTASIVVDSPTQVPDDYAGTVSGHITLAPSANRWIVQVYRDTDTGRTQVPLQTLVAPDGTFTVNLGAVSNPPAGTWALGLLDATNSYAPAGTPWPGATYDHWQVRAYVVTDTAYLVAEQPARADGTFSFPSSRPGAKVFQLVDTSTNAVLAEQAPDFGLVRSFAGGTRVYTYDQALTVLTATALGADATSFTAGLINLQAGDGGFRESADVRNPAAGSAIERTGISAVATYALLRRAQTMSASDPSRAAVVRAARAGLSWLLGRRRADGLVGAGTGDYSADGTVDPSARPAWVSTEHNLDTWQALHLAASVLQDPGYASDAATLDTAIVGTLWNGAAGRFLQGLAPNGSPDTTDPLDVSSWGALFLLAAGHPALAAQAAAHLDAFASTASGTGYRAYYPQPAFPAAPANVWVEGSAGVAVARARGGDATRSAQDLANIAALQRSDGSFPYATRADDETGMSTQSSVTATAWFVLASADQPAIW
ncbi:hypothetical protein [uncultured Jatrophihabitans sp.]|uniref:hypothetical protein n=1 Tax=uncultured Jatrophihabitans sp. TaxID=1610747 RepID=UPI0035CBCCCA